VAYVADSQQRIRKIGHQRTELICSVADSFEPRTENFVFHKKKKFLDQLSGNKLPKEYYEPCSQSVMCLLRLLVTNI